MMFICLKNQLTKRKLYVNIDIFPHRLHLPTQNGCHGEYRNSRGNNKRFGWMWAIPDHPWVCDACNENICGLEHVYNDLCRCNSKMVVLR